ncbi:MAG: DUF6602 domain-containing protein, partial [Planctomycetota bacterium]
MEELKRTDESPGVQSYYSALQRILNLQRGILTGVLTHRGERGRNEEERLRHFLRQVFPQRFGLGTGFIVSGNPDAHASNQTDIIISDQYMNSPIHRELAAEVYPIETVLATIEVKGTLSSEKDEKTGKTDLGSTLESISIVRKLANDKQYISYKSVQKKGHPAGHRVITKRVLKSTLPPRSFLFAYHTDQWKNINTLGDYIKRCLLDHMGAHLHGVVVLDKDWFFEQESYTGNERRVFRKSGDCLLKFTNALLHGIQSMPMYPMDIDVYHEPNAAHFIDKEYS